MSPEQEVARIKSIPPRSHEPLSVKVEDGALVISIGLGTAAVAIQSNEEEWVQAFRIADIPLFGRNMAELLEREDDYGLSYVTEMLSNAAPELISECSDCIEDRRPIDPRDCADSMDAYYASTTGVSEYGVEYAGAYMERSKREAPQPFIPDRHGNKYVYAITRNETLRAKLFKTLVDNGVAAGNYDTLYNAICDVFIVPEPVKR